MNTRKRSYTLKDVWEAIQADSIAKALWDRVFSLYDDNNMYLSKTRIFQQDAEAQVLGDWLLERFGERQEKVKIKGQRHGGALTVFDAMISMGYLATLAGFNQHYAAQFPSWLQSRGW